MSETMPETPAVAKLKGLEALAYSDALLEVGLSKAKGDIKYGSPSKFLSAKRFFDEIVTGKVLVSREQQSPGTWDKYKDLKAAAKTAISDLPEQEFKQLWESVQGHVGSLHDKNIKVIRTLAAEMATHFARGEKVAEGSKFVPNTPKLLQELGFEPDGSFKGATPKATGLEEKDIPLSTLHPDAKERVRQYDEKATATAQEFEAELAKHNKSALKDAMHIHAGLADIERNQDRIASITSKFKDPEAANYESFLNAGESRNLKLRKEALLSKLENSPQEVKNAYASLRKIFPTDALKKAMNSESGKTFRSLTNIAKHSGWGAIGTGYLAAELLAISTKSHKTHNQEAMPAPEQIQGQAAQSPGGWRALIQPQTQKHQSVGSIILKTTAALGAISSAVLAMEYFGEAGGIISKTASSNLLNKMIKLRKETASSVPR